MRSSASSKGFQLPTSRRSGGTVRAAVALGGLICVALTGCSSSGGGISLPKSTQSTASEPTTTATASTTATTATTATDETNETAGSDAATGSDEAAGLDEAAPVTNGNGSSTEASDTATGTLSYVPIVDPA